ncbi:chemotaxis protein CheW [Arenimonas sp. MALMAid1274]|uniref:chemotaxis protein CheW n=1 Tax=Arenimonas sp. MALMAid1274 TaxID=3411630 RepID=UPI003B9F3B9C
MTGLPANCWRVIGVQGGDQSCERLLEVLHCRNCPIYAAAARQLLDRESPLEDSDEIPSDTRRATSTRTALVFRLGQQWLGLPPGLVAEVAANPPVRRLAHRTDGRIEGVVNVRGELRLCVSLVELLGLGRRDPGGATARLVLVEDESGPLAFRCDEVRGLLPYSDDAVEPPPDTLRAPLDACVRAMMPTASGHVALLDADAVTRLLRSAVFE